MINPIHITRPGRYRMRNGGTVAIEVVASRYAYGMIPGAIVGRHYLLNGTTEPAMYDTVAYLGELEGVTAPAALSVPEEVQPVQRMLGEE